MQNCVICNEAMMAMEDNTYFRCMNAHFEYSISPSNEIDSYVILLHSNKLSGIDHFMITETSIVSDKVEIINGGHRAEIIAHSYDYMMPKENSLKEYERIYKHLITWEKFK